MEPAPFKPRIQIFVCTNARDGRDGLTSGCGGAGPGLFSALKRALARAGELSRVWVTQTGCQGHCPAHGCAVTVEPIHRHFVDARESDVESLVSVALGETRAER